MVASLKKTAGSGSFPHGIHPPERKEFAAEVAIEVMEQPAQVKVPLLQHAGAPCQALVKVRQVVAMGEPIGKADAFISAPVHSPIAAKAAKEAVTTLPNGRHVAAIPLRADGEQATPEQLWEQMFGGDWPQSGLDQHAPESIVQAVREAGIVGLGGAAFPTHVKLIRNEEKPIDTLLLNGCECEPYLTADYRLMLEGPGPIVSGALLAARAMDAGQIVVAIEDNKPAAVEVMRKAAEGTGIQVLVMKTKYPMGGERQLIKAALDREVPTGGLPLDVGVVVMNVGTTAAVARAVLRDQALTHRIVSVSGAGIEQPKNLLVAVGTPYGALIEQCGGLRPDAARILTGGPMMGFALGDMDTPVTKGTSGVTVLTQEEVHRGDELQCVRCGRCVDVCPLNLVPTKIALAAKHRDWDLARSYHMMACCECGCCAFICPSNLPLAQLIRTGKAQMPRD